MRQASQPRAIARSHRRRAFRRLSETRLFRLRPRAPPRRLSVSYPSSMSKAAPRRGQHSGGARERRKLAPRWRAETVAQCGSSAGAYTRHNRLGVSPGRAGQRQTAESRPAQPVSVRRRLACHEYSAATFGCLSLGQPQWPRKGRELGDTCLRLGHHIIIALREHARLRPPRSGHSPEIWCTMALPHELVERHLALVAASSRPRLAGLDMCVDGHPARPSVRSAAREIGDPPRAT